DAVAIRIGRQLSRRAEVSLPNVVVSGVDAAITVEVAAGRRGGGLRIICVSRKGGESRSLKRPTIPGAVGERTTGHADLAISPLAATEGIGSGNPVVPEAGEPSLGIVIGGISSLG